MSASNPVTSEAARQPTVLLVDDEAALLKLMALRLSRLGWKVHTAPDAVSAISIAERLSCHLNLLITDVNMPGMSGDALIRHIRMACPFVDVLAISGALPERHTGLANIQCLRKPFSMDRLAEAAHEILSAQL